MVFQSAWKITFNTKYFNYVILYLAADVLRLQNTFPI